MNRAPSIAASSPRWIQWILNGLTVYYLICGTTALFYPQTWDIVAGLNSTSPPLLMAVIGTLMIGQSAGALLVAFGPQKHWGVLVVLIVSTFLDLLIVISAIGAKELPLLNALGFIFIDLVCLILFTAILVAIRKMNSGLNN